MLETKSLQQRERPAFMYGSPSTGAASPKPPVPSGALDGSHKSTLCAWGYQYSELFGDLSPRGPQLYNPRVDV